jgi:hypothetical protein
MASRKHTKPTDELHIEEIDDVPVDPRPLSSARWAASNVASGKGASEALLFQMLGLIGLVGGAVLWAGAPFQSTLADAAKALGEVSLHPSTLVVVGLLLYCFARIRKFQIEQSRFLAGKDDGLLEQVAASQVHTRNALEKLAHSQSAMDEGQRTMRHELQQLTAAAERKAKEDDGSAQEAIFRLAASLDQLGARVEQRMQAQYETFHAGLQQVGNEIVAAQTDLRELLSQLPAALPAAAAQESSDPWTEPLPRGEPTAEPAQAERPQQRAAPRPQPQGPSEPISSLGVLDNIPDESAALPSPVRRVPQGSLSQPNPAAGIQKGLDANSPASRALELDTHTKLTQLSDLLADDRLRAALEDMRRNS